MSREVQRGLAPRLGRNLLLCGTSNLVGLAPVESQLPSIHLAALGGTSFRENQKAGAGMDSAASGACAACDSVRGAWQPRSARDESSGQRWGRSLVPGDAS